MSFALWLGFLLAAVLIAITPGPGAVLSMSIGMRYGYRSALLAILGLQAALLLQLVVVALGLGALLAASETAFGLLKLAGAAYLIWLGVQKWRAPVAAVVAASGDLSKRGLFVQGLLVNLTNPKAIVFIGALVPQFIDPAQPVAAQYAVIAATTTESKRTSQPREFARDGCWLEFSMSSFYRPARKKSRRGMPSKQDLYTSC